MKTLSKLIITTSILFFAFNVCAEVPHGYDHEAPTSGFKGGRLLENTDPLAEFFIEKDRSVTVTFYSEELKPVAATEQNVSVIVETDGKKTTLDFEKKGAVLVSKGSLPEGHALNLVVRFQQTPKDQSRNFRFVYEDHMCEVCKRAEYACICGH